VNVTLVFKDISTVTDFRSHVTEDIKACEDPVKYVCSECFDFHKNKRGIHKSSSTQLIDLLLCGISVLQSPEILCETGNNLNEAFPALKLHNKKFKPAGTNTLQFHIC